MKEILITRLYSRGIFVHKPWTVDLVWVRWPEGTPLLGTTESYEEFQSFVQAEQRAKELSENTGTALETVADGIRCPKCLRLYRNIGELDYKDGDVFCPDCEIVLSIGISDESRWCAVCVDQVEPEGRLNAQGIYSVCPKCGERLEE